MIEHIAIGVPIGMLTGFVAGCILGVLIERKSWVISCFSKDHTHEAGGQRYDVRPMYYLEDAFQPEGGGDQ